MNPFATKSREISKPREKEFESFNRSAIFQASLQHCCLYAWKIADQYEKSKNDITHPQVFARFDGKESIRLVNIGLKPLGYTVHMRTAGVAQCHGHMEKTHPESIIYPITSSYHEISHKIGYWNILIALEICRMISSSFVNLLIKLKGACHILNTKHPLLAMFLTNNRVSLKYPILYLSW